MISERHENKRLPVTYPKATEKEVSSFRNDGYLVVEDGIDPADLVSLEAACERILDKKEKVAFDWGWREGTAKEEREFRLVQASPSLLNPDLLTANRFRKWMIEYSSLLMGHRVEFWYDQFLAKPPANSVPTNWHQDEGYWGRNLNERGITCWMPLHDVGLDDGCMNFIVAGHKDGVLEHKRVPGVQSDLLYCEVDESRQVACPVKLGDVTFHHGKMPHMTCVNNGKNWRKILTNHFRLEGSKGEGDHYPWKIYVNQFTGEVIKPESR